MGLKDSDQFIKVKAKIYFKTAEQGGRSVPIRNGYRPNHFFDLLESNEIMSAYVGDLKFDDPQPIYPGETKMVMVRFLNVPEIINISLLGRNGELMRA